MIAMHGLLLALVLAPSGCGRSGALPADAAAAADATAPAPDAARPSTGACATPRPGTKLSARRLGRVTGSAVLAASPPGDRRVFVVEQRGAIRIFSSAEVLLPAPFLDLGPDAGGPVLPGAESGLLGLAFHPQYAANGEFYIFYTAGPPGALRDVVARCTASADPNRANPACTEVLSIPDFSATHNGGMLEFGPDGLLYIGTGDGGGQGDPYGNGQSLADGQPLPGSVALLGKLLRIDVDARVPGREYSIPADNPYAAGGGAPEIYMLGLRNPWRWSFDRATGDLWLADVGQDALEELTVLAPAEQRGANLGWPMYEGTRCYAPPCSPEGMVFPQHTRAHDDGWAAIVGGQVYRGTCYPDLAGAYLFTDYAAGGSRGVIARAVRQPDRTLLVETVPGMFPANPTSLHEAGRGELYLTTTIGDVYRLEAR